ncbi:hypothetical protein MTR67_001026 [Solanum verrucosum]|uniref:Uncharacterized protein n=1 Tax=Solanum verrucosum TaxID=315347 RepID=A0AAF0T748_SOLVR|nr:hypothetical protein MTR67_001026 [Solanum verrucosum]
MNAPRCLFGSASFGEIVILAGGCDSRGNLLRAVELYNSETGTCKILPSMKKRCKMCSEVRKYDKQNKAQVTMNGWDLAFRACGDRLIVIGEPRAIGVGYFEVNSWVQVKDPLSGTCFDESDRCFVYNCPVVGC